MTPDYLDTKAAEVVDRILDVRENSVGSYIKMRDDLIAYVRAVLDLTETRGAMRGAGELGEAMTGEKA